MVQQIIDQAGEFRVLVPPSIDPKMLINAATDTFDQNDGKGGSHDTILMLFQTALPKERDRESLTISTRMSDGKRFSKITRNIVLSNTDQSSKRSITRDYSR